MAKRRRSKPIYYCVVMPTRSMSVTMGAVYGCSTKPEVAKKRLERAIDRGAKNLRIDTTFHPPKDYGKWLPPTD